MLRVAVWTGGLFALGCIICQLFPEPFLEPVVLLALGTTLFLIAGRGAPARAAAGAEEQTSDVEGTRAAR